MNYRLFRKKHPRFIYKNFNYSFGNRGLCIAFNFLLEPDIWFNPTLIIRNVDKKKIQQLQKRELDNLIFHLGLMEIPTYWKAAVSPNIVIEAGYLNKDQIAWWQDLIIKGMGEFFYKNKINFREKGFLKVTTQVYQNTDQSFSILKKFSRGVIVPVGGGKDSVVTLELLKKNRVGVRPLLYNPTEQALEVVKASGLKNYIVIERKMDRKLWELNREGYLNGHTPFSAYLAFLSVVCAAIFDYKYIALSNERSANEGNVRYLGSDINHQYSKSFEFEKKFSEYAGKYLTKEINYFSFLRPLYELQIARLFSKYPKYFSVFLSCNEAYKTFSGSRKPTKKWCCKCSKCLFVFIALCPFIGKRKMVKIFGRNLLADRSLLPILQELIGEKKFKPFECVGTKDEVLVALWLTLRDHKGERELLLTYFEKRILPKYPHMAELSKRILGSWNSENLLSSDYARSLRMGILELSNILILGFGREGRDAFAWIREHFPEKELGVADKLTFAKLPVESIVMLEKDKHKVLHLGKAYLNSIKRYDLIIKSPGIPPDIVEKVSYPTQVLSSVTQIFFDLHRGTIIGVTGTKGKSTTASLIYEMLRQGKRHVHLIGNIEKPVLNFVDKSSDEDIFVYELSSFQLENLDKSPHIAVLLNFYKEHLDYHKDFTRYVEAKENITRFQRTSDYFIFNNNDAVVRKMALRSHAIKIPFNFKGNDGLRSKGFIATSAPARIVGELFKIPKREIEKTLANFKSLPHRLEYVGKYGGIDFYNDSLATVPEATMAALNFLGGKVETLIVGGFDRGLDFQELARAILKGSIKTVVLFPTTGEKIWKEILSLLKRGNVKIPKHFLAQNMEEAVNYAYLNTARDKACLLSPASPSFNMFKDYKDRGDQFKKMVARYMLQ